MCSKVKYLAIICGFMVAFSAPVIYGESTLKAVAMLTRHGDRAPEQDYPLNPYPDYKWPGGYGALSPKGVRELYYSGMIKARRYAALFVPKCSFCSFDIKKVYFRSSIYPRCIESGRSFLAGFLPVPYPDNLVHYTEAADDNMLAFGKFCEKFEYQRNEWKYLNHTAYKELLIDIHSDEGRQFVEYVSNNTGLPIEKFPTSTNLIQIQLDNGLPLPTWASSIFDKLLAPLYDLGLDIYGASTYSKIRSGVLLKDIMDRFLDFLSGGSEQNILFYSAHDVTLMGMLNHLDVRDQLVDSAVAYGGMFHFEIYDNSAISGDYEIKLAYYRKYGDQDPVLLNIPNCKAPCSLKKYLKTVQSKYTLDFDAACQN